MLHFSHYGSAYKCILKEWNFLACGVKYVCCYPHRWKVEDEEEDDDDDDDDDNEDDDGDDDDDDDDAQRLANRMD